MGGSRWLKRVAMSNSSIPPKRAASRFPTPKRDIPVGTLKSIEKQSGLKLR
jgi:hypothetical protein